MTGEVEAGSPAEAPAGSPPPPDDGLGPKTFEAMGLLPEVKQAIIEMGYLDPMPVQSIVFARMMAGRDVMVQSRTGSGKTAAFGIPFAQGLIAPEKKVVQALVLAPTRELALQVAKECGRIGQYRDLSVVPIYGGAPMQKQVDMLKAGSQIVAGTPGRVLDHLRRGTLRLDGLKMLVLDEADEMLSMGFLEEITEIIRQCPKDRQTTLFSATIPDDIERIGSRYMRNPEKVTLSSDGVGAREIHHCYYMVSGMGRTRDLMRILDIEKPESAIIFCNTRDDTNVVAEFLKKNGIDAEAISSDLTQNDRERVMNRSKAKNLKYLVATDIAARGIDITDLSHVINYTFPESAEVYVHRTGRTGRAGKSGVAISLISPRELGNFYMLKLTYKIKPEERTLPAPSSDQYKTLMEAQKVDELRKQLGDRQVSEDWLKVARRLWASEDGERFVAALIEDRLSPDRKRVGDPNPQVAKLPSAAPPMAPQSPIAAAAAALVSEGEPARSREPREPREGNGDREGRSRRGGRRSRRDREDRGPASQAGAPRQARSESSRPSPSPDGARKGDGGRPASSGGQPRPKMSETIDTSDGREFWEAWVDSKAEPSPSPALSGGADGIELPPTPPRERGPRRERERDREPEKELAPGQVRLYLNLGRRDGLREAEIAALLLARQVTVDEVQVRNSHTYLIVQESAEPAVLAAFNDGQKHNDREIKAERARARNAT